MLRIAEPNLTILNHLYEKYYDDHTATWNLCIHKIEENDKELIDENLIVDLCHFLEYYQGIRHLNISGNSIGEIGIAALSQNTTLLSLDLNDAIRSDRSHVIVSIISKNNTLRSLKLKRSGFNEDQIAQLVTMQNLTSLDLRDIEFVNYNNLLSTLATFPKLTTLKFSPRLQDITIGMKALARRNQLTSLDIDDIRSLGQHTCDEIASILASMPLTYLSWNGSNITFKGVNALSKSKTLQILNLSHSELDEKCAIELAKSTSIIDLDISYNNIGSEGASAIATNIYIKKLDISVNKIEDLGIKAISTMTLTSLSARSNKITNVGLGFISQCKSLVELELDDPEISDIGISLIAKYLIELRKFHVDKRLTEAQQLGFTDYSEHPNIISHNLSNHYITTSVAKILCNMQNIRKLRLDGSNLDSSIIELVLNNHSLVKFGFYNRDRASYLTTENIAEIIQHIKNNALRDKKQSSLKTKHQRDFIRLAELTGQLQRQPSKVFLDQHKKDTMCAILSNEVAKQITHFDQGHNFLLFGKTKQESLSNMAKISKLGESHPAERNNNIVDVIKNIKPR